MTRIGVLTSGGDAPGMNAAIRAVVRSALARGAETIGFRNGWSGVMAGEAIHLDSPAVGGIIGSGGTILRSAREPKFREPEGRAEAAKSIKKEGVEGLVVIGGDGSLAGARLLSEEHDIPVMGIPGSIDNDIPGTDFSIGFDTAINTATEAIDKVRDTAYSHDRVFVIEVMGRANGFIALDVALACGAEAVLIPEVPFDLDGVFRKIDEMRSMGKKSSLIVTAEGAIHASRVVMALRETADVEARPLVLGHMQRGGSPSAYDRILALRLGSLASNRLLSGYSCEMVGVERRRLIAHPLTYVQSITKKIDPEKLLLAEVMAS